MVRVRFAPSPTGYLHVGAARTALFNWLFARQKKGAFILRIEDTDEARSSAEMSKGIFDGLEWLGLDWDEGPVFQSERLDVYRRRAEELVKKGHAYACYCLPEEMEKRRQESIARNEYWSYDRHCLNLAEETKKRYETDGRPRAIRFLVPEGKVEYKDILHGLISVELSNIEDFVLLRRDGLPTYHLSVVVDDIEQKITHIIRGDDHISNTPKQILLYRGFGIDPPRFAHQSLILGPDRKKLSKRHGVTSLAQFRDDGYLPLALLNFLARMGWLPGDEPKIYTLTEMKDKFSLESISKASPVFDPAKLEWLNGQVISGMTSEKLAALVENELKNQNMWSEDLDERRKAWFLKLIELLKGRSRTVKELAGNCRPFISDDLSYDMEGTEKYLADGRLESLIPKLIADLKKMDKYIADDIEHVLRSRAEREGVKAAILIHAVRMLVLGMPKSPGIFEVLELIGKEKTITRLEKLPRVKNK